MNENNLPAKAAAKPAKKTLTLRKAETANAKPEKKIKKEKKAESKVKVVRDSFTMPQIDYDIIAELKEKGLKSGLHVKKSELLRAGLRVLSKLSAAQLKQTVINLEKIKTGRPKNS